MAMSSSLIIEIVLQDDVHNVDFLSLSFFYVASEQLAKHGITWEIRRGQTRVRTA